MNLHHGLISAGKARGILLRGDEEEDKTGRYLLRSVASGDDVISYVMRNEEIGHLCLPSEHCDIVKNNPNVSRSISEKVCSSVKLMSAKQTYISSCCSTVSHLVHKC